MSEIRTGGGRQKTLELNLVPFIDLMSVLITFLLITAVWSQVSMIQIGSSIYGKKTDDTPTPPPENDVVLKVEIRTKGYRLVLGKEARDIPKLAGEKKGEDGDYDDENLTALLTDFKKLYPTKTDGAIAMEDDLPYERLIHVMDSFLKAGFSDINVLTGGPY